MDSIAEDRLSHLEQENKNLRRAIEELSILNEIATVISSTMSLNQIVDLMVQKCVKHLKVEQAAVMVLDEKQSDNPFQTMVRRADTTTDILPYRLDTQLTGWMLKHQKPLLVNDLQTDERFVALVEKNFPIRSILSVPLLSKGRMIGIISLFNKKMAEGFGNEDRRLLTIIATQSAQIIENARLLEEEQALIRMREEMRMAYDIQVNLLPTKTPHIDGYDIAGMSIPAREVGGDYYDFIPYEEDRLAFCLGDVTGKGLSAALLMANLQATIRSQSVMLMSPGGCLRNANKLMFQSTGEDKFVTMFYGILNTRDHTLSFCNAGHDHPFLFSNKGEITRLKTGGVVLGFVMDYPYAEEVIRLEPGHRFVLYSDGVTEAKDAAEEEFGEEKLAQIALQNPHLSSAALIDGIVREVREHAGSTPQSDDVTLVVITRKATE